jgi:Rod binding domain-containing protein
MNPLSVARSASQAVPSDERTKKAMHAAHDFEAVLLNNLLGSLEHSFAALAGDKKKDPAADSYQSMGIQALASSLARGGGIGIASMIVPSLLRPGGHELNGVTAPPKVFPASADNPVSGTPALYHLEGYAPRQGSAVRGGSQIKGF